MLYLINTLIQVTSASRYHYCTIPANIFISRIPNNYRITITNWHGLFTLKTFILHFRAASQHYILVWLRLSVIYDLHARSRAVHLDSNWNFCNNSRIALYRITGKCDHQGAKKHEKKFHFRNDGFSDNKLALNTIITHLLCFMLKQNHIFNHIDIIKFYMIIR